MILVGEECLGFSVDIFTPAGSVTVDESGFLVVQGVGGPVAHAMVETDSLGGHVGSHPDLIGDHMDGGHASSEDNLSHDSYELIEKNMMGLVPISDVEKQPPVTTASGTVISSANQFEQEFYRQAAQASNKAKNGGNTVSSSRTSSHCSLNMSPQVIPRNEVVQVALHEHLVGKSPNNSINRIKSQDSFSQSSNHNNHNQQALIDQHHSSLTSLTSSRNQTNAGDNNNDNENQDREGPTVIEVPSDMGKDDSRLMVDIVRGGRGRSSGPAYGVSQSTGYSHSLPRSNADIIYHHNQQAHHQHQEHHQQHLIQQGQQQQSRTLPSRRRERSPVYYSRSRIMSGGHGTHDCSSGSSSSHASPQIARPKSLEFAVVNVSALPSKQAFAYHDDSLELHHVQQGYEGSSPAQHQHYNKQTNRYGMEPPQPKPRLHLTAKPIDLYDDSSSAMNEQLSSSDVPQTPENPNVTFLPLEAGPVIVGTCHQGIVRKQYYTTEERIYDVPEGIEGVSIPIKVITSQPPQVDMVTSPSTSSGITEEGNGGGHQGLNQVPPGPIPAAVTVIPGSTGIIQEGVDTSGNVPQPKNAPPPPPHQPVIAQHVLRQNHRGLASSVGLAKADRPKGSVVTVVEFLSGAVEIQ